MPLTKAFTQQLTLMGRVVKVLDDPNEERPGLVVRLRSGDEIEARLMPTSWISTVQNLDLLDRDRYPDVDSELGEAAETGRSGDATAQNQPQTTPETSPPPEYKARESDDLKAHRKKLKRVFSEEVIKSPDGPPLVVIEGTYYVDDNRWCFDALVVHLLKSQHPTDPPEGRYVFEHTAWWIVQITAMADQWLDSLFGEKRTYQRDDFAALYRTNLNILGLPTDDNRQEVATLSRLIYGLSSAYLLTGQERYLLAAKAGVEYQREAFRLISADGRFCFWAHAKKKLRYGSRKIMPSESPDDAGSLPLYEQIYALAGLGHYYRITYDPEVLFDIQRTLTAFWTLYKCPGCPGFFSHIDYATFSPREPRLGKNHLRMNWNSIGDHIPAFLIDLILALDPVPHRSSVEPKQSSDELGTLLCEIEKMLDELADLIADRFPSRDDNKYVVERFKLVKKQNEQGKDAEVWEEDLEWDWQQNRAVVGHNLKIAWNLTRVANYDLFRADRLKAPGKEAERQKRELRAKKLIDVATKLADDMGRLGIDQVRGGCFDSVEREPKNGMPVQFPWRNTKDFWQQEQGVLAYHILYGHLLSDTTQEGLRRRRNYLDLAREMTAFWNLFFLDRERSGIFFRVTADGTPVIESKYGQKGERSVSGYHAFELNFLVQVYQRSYLPHKEHKFTVFVMNFHPSRHSGIVGLNVLPDFVKPGDLEISEVIVNGLKRNLNRVCDNGPFQIRLEPEDLGQPVQVKLRQTASCFERTRDRSQASGDEAKEAQVS